jgi:hypothetical protein
MSNQVKPEDITLEDIRVCINIIKIFKKYYEAVAPLSPSERDFIKWIVAKTMESYRPTTTTIETEVTGEEEELSKEMLEKIRSKYKKQPQKS